MLNFLISTSAFSLAAFILNRVLKTHPDSSKSITFIVVVIATIASMGAGWAVDELDGDAKLHKNDHSMMEVVKSGDPLQIVKMLIGL
jgi:hypothetical protein